MEWLNYLNDKNIIPEVPVTVQNKYASKSKYYKKDKHTFCCDGFNRTDKSISEFYGCFYHGCPKCVPNRKPAYEKTMEREKLFIEAGFKVNSMWECDWLTLKKTLPNKKTLEQEAKEQKIRVRDAFFGGRTEGFKKKIY